MQIDHVSKFLLHVQSNYENGYFSKHFFSLSNVHHFFSKLKRILTLMIIKKKSLEINKIHFKMHLNIFVSNVFLTLKIMNFENVPLTKVIHFSDI
jgi:hypothetical protein